MVPPNILTKAKCDLRKACESEYSVGPRGTLWWALQALYIRLWSLTCWSRQWPISIQWGWGRRNHQRRNLGYMEWRTCCDWWLNNQSGLARELMKPPWDIPERGEVIIFGNHSQDRPSWSSHIENVFTQVLCPVKAGFFVFLFLPPPFFFEGQLLVGRTGYVN